MTWSSVEGNNGAIEFARHRKERSTLVRKISKAQEAVRAGKIDTKEQLTDIGTKAWMQHEQLASNGRKQS